MRHSSWNVKIGSTGSFDRFWYTYFEGLEDHLKITFRLWWRDQCVPEVWGFEFHQSIFKKITKAGLNSLQQKGCQILVKNWIFEDPIHNKGPVLVILVARMIKQSGSGSFLRKKGCRGCWGQQGCRGHWGQWGCRGF